MDSAQYEDRSGNPRLPQLDPFLQAGNTEVIDEGRGGFSYANQAMAIGIRLDGKTEAAWANVFPDGEEVSPKLG